MIRKSLLFVVLATMSLGNWAIGQELSDEEFCAEEAVELEVPEEEHEDYIVQCIASLVPQNELSEEDHSE